MGNCLLCDGESEFYGKTIFLILTSCCSISLVMLFSVGFFANFPILRTFLRVVGGRVGTGGISESLQGSLRYS